MGRPSGPEGSAPRRGDGDGIISSSLSSLSFGNTATSQHRDAVNHTDHDSVTVGRKEADAHPAVEGEDDEQDQSLDEGSLSTLDYQRHWNYQSQHLQDDRARDGVVEGRDRFSEQQNFKHQQYLDAMGKLSELGIDERLPIPRLVVVGKQSSGKSSLLEAIIRYNLPVHQSLCTRFATQVDLRTGLAGRTSGKAWILKRAEDGSLTPSRTIRTFSQEELNADGLTEVFEHASELMGLPPPGRATARASAARFSRDILKVEITGPGYANLSLVDVPGLFETETETQTAEDRKLVDEIVNDFITPAHTTILAVADAPDQLVNQRVLQLAKTVDPAGCRTIGVITKVDLIELGTEQRILEMATGNERPLKLGWFLIRNRSSTEHSKGITFEQRDAKETQFFSRPEWNILRKGSWGIGSLVKFLSGHLYTRIREELPGLLSKIMEVIKDLELERQALGPARDSASKQRAYLTDRAQMLQTRFTALWAGEAGQYYEKDHPLKLKTSIHTLKEKYQEEMTSHGHQYVFWGVPPLFDDPDFKKEGTSSASTRDWIREKYLDRLGLDLAGTVNNGLIKTLFKEQTIPWEEISLKLLENAMETIQRFTDDLVNEVFDDKWVAREVRGCLEPAQQDMEEKAKEMLCDDLTMARGLRSLNTQQDTYFATLTRFRAQQIMEMVKTIVALDGTEKLDFERLCEHVGGNMHDDAVRSIHDVLKAYYVAARSRFVEHTKDILELVVDQHCAVLKLTPTYISTLTDEGLALLASERGDTAVQREQTIEGLSKFHRALKVIHDLERDLAAGVPATP